MTAQQERKALTQDAAKRGWFNWYVNRGRLSPSPTRKELRAVSWRRTL